MARVTGVGGVFIKARDPKALAEWYETHLGMTRESWGGVVFHWEEDARATGAAGATVWHLAEEGSDWFGGPVMINYRVDDLDGLLAKLAAAGIEPLKPTESEFNGRFSWIEDPEGNRLELWEPKDPS